MRVVKIRDIAEINPRSERLNPQSLVTFLPMPSVTEGGQIKEPQIKCYEEVRTGFTPFANGDVLVAKITPCFENNKGCLASNLENGVGFGSTEFHVLRACEDVLPEYLHLVTRTHLFRGKGELNMTGSAGQKRVPVGFIENFEIVLPSLGEQKDIVELLSFWNNAIEKTESLIAAKRKQFNALTQQLISKRCEEWEHRFAREIFETVSIKNVPDEELLSVTQERGAIPRRMLEGRVMSPAGSTAGYKLVEPGNFIISLRSFQGGLEYSEYRGIVSPAYTVLETKIELDTSFYRHFLKSYIFVEKYLTVAVIGIRDGKQISAPDFATVKIPVPPLEQQRKIGQVLDTAAHEIELLERQAENFRTQKRGLMQKLLTGEWRVKGAA